MKQSLSKCSLLLVLLIPFLFFIWHRKTPGRSTSDPGGSDIRDLTEFDETHPTASEELRQIFLAGVQAHLNGDIIVAKVHYNRLLSILPGEPNALHNLREIGKK